jgi:hypothetical protein
LLSAVCRNGSFVLIILAGICFYFARTVPAEFRLRALQDREERSRQEVERLRIEAEQWELLRRGIEEQDPAVLSRVVMIRWTQGRDGVTVPSRDEENGGTQSHISSR